MLGGSQGLGGTSQRTGGLWPLASAPVSPATSFTSDGYSKYGFYSLFAGAPTFGSTLYSHNTVGRFGPALQAPGATAFHTTHKVSDSLFSTTGYTFGAPTPPPGSPYSPVPVAQLEFLTKGYTTTTNSNIIIQHQPSDLSSTPSPKKNIIITPSDKDLQINKLSNGNSAFRQQSQSTFKHHQQAQYIYQPAGQTLTDGSCLMKLTTLTSSSDKNCHAAGHITGCSRTNPLEWTTLSPIHVKKEPGTLLLSDLNHQGEALIKMEMTSPVQKESVMPNIVTANGNIPVGIAVGRQRIQQEVAPSGILTTTHFKEVARISEIGDMNAAAHHAVLQHHHHHQLHHSGGGGTGDMLGTAGTSWGLMGSQHCHQGPSINNGHQHNGAGTTLWTTQYPTPLPMEPLMPMSAVGLPLQLVREPTSGGFLLFPTTGIEPVQQTAAIQLWPTAAPTTTNTYPTPSPAHVILPPPPPLQLLTSAQAHQQHHHNQQQDNYLSAMIATSSSCNNNNNNGLVTTISNAHGNGQSSVNAINHSVNAMNQSGRLHLVSSNNVQQESATVFGTIEQHQGVNAKLITSASMKDYQEKMCTSVGGVIKVEEGAVMQSCHVGSTALLNSFQNEQQQQQQQVSPVNLQIFESTPTSVPVLTTTHLIYQPSQTQMSNNVIVTTQTSTTASDATITNNEQQWKQTHHSTIGTSTMTCLTPPPDTGDVAIRQANVNVTIEEVKSDQIVPEQDVSAKQVCEVEKLHFHDAGNQTESISDEESATVDTRTGLELEEVVPNATVVEDLMEVEKLIETSEEVVNETVQQEVEPEPFKPDFSGLDLLSNSILEHENSRHFTEEVPELSDPQPEVTATSIAAGIADENFGGLDLLCALAEQRLEEVASRNNSQKPELVKLRRNAIDLEEEPEVKKPKMVEELLNISRKCNNCNCNVDDEPYKSYKTKESEEEVKKFIASKAPSLMEYNKEMAVNGSMNDSERDMRQQLADLQRKYKEKQRELHKLKPHHSNSKIAKLDNVITSQKKKHRKKSTHSNSTDRDTSPQPPLLEPQVELLTIQRHHCLSQPEAPPTDESSNKPIEKRRYSSTNNPNSKRRRKVGRPKKLEWSSDNDSSSNYLINPSTETIVAKKAKRNLVGYLLAAKEKLLVQKGYADSPPRFIEDAPANNKVVNKKIGPKLKAEARISVEMSDEEKEDNAALDKIAYHSAGEDSEIDETIDISETNEEPERDRTTTEDDCNQIPCEQSSNTFANELESIEQNGLTTCNLEEELCHTDKRCVLTRELLENDRLRVLTAMGGLFYAGNLNAVQPPDVYSITLDGERGNRPHIMSREEILRDAIVEVSPASTEDLSPGTRLCAYWSQQYRCLYPGSVAEPASPRSSPREIDKRFVTVEFDDGDNGTIAIEDIRFLPSDYPIIEYDPNPLLSLSKRKRRLSTTEDRKITQSPSVKIPESPQTAEKENKDVNTLKLDTEQIQRNKERKRLKKRKREKIREKRRCQIDGELKQKKKKRKHKCLGEQCKHKRHHKKHKKHHRRHHQRESKDRKVNGEEQLIPDEVTDAAETEQEVFPEYHIVPNTDEEVTMDDIIDASSKSKSKKIRDRQESCESRSKMSAFLPPRQFWNWSGKGYKRPRGKGRSKKEFFKSIQRGKENMSVGDSAVFLSTGRPDRPYIGKIEAFWETCGTMVVKVKWFYHPEETNGCPLNLKYPGALFESPHIDENDVQTISHRCRVVSLSEYTATLGSDPTRYATIYDNNDIYYRAGYYDPTTCLLTMENDIPLEDE